MYPLNTQVGNRFCEINKAQQSEINKAQHGLIWV